MINSIFLNFLTLFINCNKKGKMALPGLAVSQLNSPPFSFVFVFNQLKKEKKIVACLIPDQETNTVIEED